MPTPSTFDLAHLGEILSDVEGRRYHNFDAHLFRLINKADRENRAWLRVVYPEHVEAVEAWRADRMAAMGART